MGALHAHFSGGEPLLRDDLEALIAHAHGRGLYTNLITSAVGLDTARLDALVGAGVEHVQVSFQSSEAAEGDAIAGLTVHAQKLRVAEAIAARGVALSLNVVLHALNLSRVDAMIALAASLGACRIELANTQFHGSALANVDALLPRREALDEAWAAVEARRARHRGALDIVWVMPDYVSDRPRRCTDGWGSRFVTVDPEGTVWPCAGAHGLPGMERASVRTRGLADIWVNGLDFNRFRGTAWMPEPCQSCPERHLDLGGCRCQAFALTGVVDATDPACDRAPAHGRIVEARARAAQRTETPLVPLRRRRADPAQSH